MDNDLLLVFGIIIAALAFPSLLNAYSTGQPPRTAAMLLIVGGGMVTWAVTQQPNSYSMAELPQVFMRVFAGLIG
ncbi:MAG: hypothetical protein ACU0CA_00925 [Paracoccaceae bacterium]